MNALAITRVAGRALLRNRLRSLLTALGVVIGVGAVIAMVAIGEGAKRRVEQTFEAMGTNLLIVLPGSSSSMGMRGGFGSQATLTWSDLKAVRSECKAVAAASPVLTTHTVVRVEDQNWTTSVVGASTEYMGIRNWQMARGRFYDQSDIDTSQQGRRPRRDRGRQPVGQGIRPRRTDGTHPDGAVQGHRRAREEGPVAHGPGLRRHGPDALHRLFRPRSQPASAATSTASSS